MHNDKREAFFIDVEVLKDDSLSFRLSKKCKNILSLERIEEKSKNPIELIREGLESLNANTGVLLRDDYLLLNIFAFSVLAELDVSHI